MIPQFEQIRIQALKILKSGAVMRAKDFRVPLAEHFHLTDDEMNAWYPSGNGEIFLIVFLGLCLIYLSLV